MKIVIKIGGDLLKEGIPKSLVEELGSLSSEHDVVLVHGGGDIVTEIATKLGHPPKFVTSQKGFRSRYTDKETIEIFTMVMAGKINKEIVSALQSHGIQAIGLSGLDASLVRAKRKKQIIAVDERGRRMLLEGDYTGTIEEVNAGFLGLLMENGYTPIMASLAMSENAEPLNVDGDRMAANVASAIGADRLILLTDVEGIHLNDKPVRQLRSNEAREIMDQIGPGMITKLYASLEAIDGGVGEVLIGSGFKEGAIASALSHENGTVIEK